jgi:hypothetical protein
MQFVDDRTCHVSEPTRNPVPIDRSPNGFRDNQTDQRCPARSGVGFATGVYNNGRLRRSNAASHRESEFRSPPHPVLGRQHCALP